MKQEAMENFVFPNEIKTKFMKMSKLSYAKSQQAVSKFYKFREGCSGCSG